MYTSDIQARYTTRPDQAKPSIALYTAEDNNGHCSAIHSEHSPAPGVTGVTDSLLRGAFCMLRGDGGGVGKGT